MLFPHGSSFDIMHANSIEILDRDIGGLAAKDKVLISIRELDLIGIFDVDKGQLIWSWGPRIISKQHHPTVLENGNILLFDNGCDKGYSRIIELDPEGMEIVWSYEADPKEEFFSPTRGSSQRLDNGNTLICESDKGHVFEVTKDGETVWQFYSTGEETKAKQRQAIYRMERLLPKVFIPLTIPQEKTQDAGQD